MEADAKRESYEMGAGDDDTKLASGRLGIRHVQMVLLFLGMTIGYCLRMNISVAVVAMANSTTANPDYEDYGWNEQETSVILSSFFWGYTITQVPSGYAAGVWSAQKVLSIGMFVCGALNLVMPFAAHYGGLIAVCACRVGMGLFQGCLYPCVHTLLSKWAPPSERARLGTFAYAGAQVGTIIAFPISGTLAASAAGWPFIFYLFGALGMLWSVLFFILGSDSPARHKGISDDERRYIEESLRVGQSEEADHQKKSIPWKEIFTSLPMWAIIVAHGGQNWGFWTLSTKMPSYMKSVLHYKIQENGFISALPYLAMWILSFPVSWFSDLALKKGVSRATTRKVSNTIADWGPAAALISLGFVPTNVPTPAVAILVVAVGLNAGSLCGFQINHIDLSPNYAGTMMSISNCFASVIAIVAPLICGAIVSDETSVNQWSTVFYLAAAIYFVTNLFFVLFGKGEVQWWNDPEAVRDRREGKSSVENGKPSATTT